MLEFLNIESTLKFLISTLFGSMIFFSVVIAPTVFKILDQKNSRELIRNIFPKLYSWGILFSFAICILQIQTLNISFYLSLLMFLGFILKAGINGIERGNIFHSYDFLAFKINKSEIYLNLTFDFSFF